MGIVLAAKDGAPAATYTAVIDIKNDGLWEYHIIDISKFGSAFNNLTHVPGWESRVEAFTFPVGRLWGESYSPQYHDVPTSVYLDEMLFIKGVGEDYITPPSLGESLYETDTSIYGILIGGLAFKGLEGKTTFDITVPKGMTAAEVNMDNMGIGLTCGESPGSSYDQVKTGAIIKDFISPESIPGTGKLLVLAGNRVKTTEYTVNVRYRDGIYVETGSLSLEAPYLYPVPGSHTETVSAQNDGTRAGTAAVIAVVSDRETGEVYSMDYKIISLEPGERKDLQAAFNVPHYGCELSLYYLDNLTSLNLMEAIRIGE